MKLYFITGNKNKFEEVRAVLPDVRQLALDIPEIQGIDAREIIKAKILEAMKHFRIKGRLIVEDTSLSLDCLSGLPGPLIKWFLKTIGNKGLYQIAKRFGNFKAEAKTIIGYARSAKEIHFFEGTVKGRIVSPRGESNFGWDPIFLPAGFSKTFAELGREEKNKISMRRLALNKLKKFLGKKKDG